MSKIMNGLAELAKQIQNNPDPDDKIDDEKFLLERLEKFPHYFSSVIMMEYSMKMMSPFDDPNYTDKVQRMDHSRRIAHMAATDAINQINRLCVNYNLNPIFNIPEDLEKLDSNSSEHREIAADIVYVFCKEVFLDAKSKERYNNLEYTTQERNNELLDIGQTGYFKEHVSVDDLIRQAKQDNTSKINKTSEDDFCL